MVPRNSEVIRQWTILREIERARLGGLTIDELADTTGVTTRTIRRDLEALQIAGFPLFDDKGDDGRTRWKMNGQAFRGLAAGLTLSELCALYFSRTLVKALGGTPFGEDVESAFDKLTVGLTPKMREFLDDLPNIIASKPEPTRRRDDPEHQRIVARALEATLQHRQAAITYYSVSSNRTKSYVVHPNRLVYAQGGMYLLAYVPEYQQVRTFAMERIQSLSLLEEHFTPIPEMPDEAFPHSLGVHSGPPEEVVIEFQPGAAEYVRARTWHQSQQIVESGDGRLTMTLRVCLDDALHSWILSFGPLARVVAPAELKENIAERFEEALRNYEAIRA